MMLEEQEVNINFGRTDEYATAYVSDQTWITKLDKLVEKSNGLFTVISSTVDRDKKITSKTYKFPKKLISLRSSLRNVSPEQKKALVERLRKGREEKANERTGNS